MDDGVTDVCEVVDSDFSLPEQLMLAQENEGKKGVMRIIRQVHYCWAQTE